MAEPFAWGTADCLTRVADVCEAMTGVNPFPRSLRRYRTAAGSVRLLARYGFNDVAEALASTFPEIPVAEARPGDCGVARITVSGLGRYLAAFIITGNFAVGANEGGPIGIPTSILSRAFAIG